VKETVLHAFDNKEYPLSMMISDKGLNRNISRSPMFDVFVQLIEGNDEEQDVRTEEGPTISSYDLKSSQSKYDLVFNYISSKQGIELVLEYSTELFKRETVERLLGRVMLILKNFERKDDYI
jgi:non-ribosomal peptide synthetase component F